MTRNLIRVPEMDMNVDQLSERIETLADKKIQLTQEIIQIEMDMIMVMSILTRKVADDPKAGLGKPGKERDYQSDSVAGYL